MSVLAPFEIWHYLSLRLATCLHRASETSYSWVSSYLTGNFSHFPFCIPFSQSNSGGLQSSILCPCLFSICIYIVRCPDRISLLNSNTVYPFVSSKFSLGYLINILTLSNKQDTCSVSVKDSPSFWLFRLKILFLALLFLSYVTPSHSGNCLGPALKTLYFGSDYVSQRHRHYRDPCYHHNSSDCC